MKLVRAFEQARAAAAAKQITWAVEVALHTAAPGYYLPGHLSDIGAELDYPGYARQPATLKLIEDTPSRWTPLGGSMLQLDSPVTFKCYQGKFPLVVTHAILWCKETGLKIQQELRKHMIVQNGDCMHFVMGSITVPPFHFDWEQA